MIVRGVSVRQGLGAWYSPFTGAAKKVGKGVGKGALKVGRTAVRLARTDVSLEVAALALSASTGMPLPVARELVKVFRKEGKAPPGTSPKAVALLEANVEPPTWWERVLSSIGIG